MGVYELTILECNKGNVTWSIRENHELVNSGSCETKAQAVDESTKFFKKFLKALDKEV